MDKAVIYIHGKGGNAEEAIHYKPLFSNCDVIGLDYTAQFPWEAKEEFPLLFNSIYRNYKTVEVIANSIGAYFAINALSNQQITRNGNGPYDLDYNLVVIKADERYWKDLRLLKDTVRNALNKAERKDFFSDAMDSRSCLTTLLHFNDSPNVEFSFDVAILTKNRNGDYMRLIHNKNAFCVGYDQYTWNEVPKSHDIKEKADAIKAEGLWQEARDRYVELKSMYLSRQDNTHPSFIVYVEAVNEIYYKYFR